MLQPTNIAPKVSAYVYIYRQHDFNTMLLAPMGCSVLLHNKPDIRKTWDDHAINGFYIKTSREYYWFFKIWVKSTMSMQFADTVFFKHQYVTVPNTTKADAIIVASTLVKVLQCKIPTNIWEQEKEQLTRLMIILHTAVTNKTNKA